MEKLNDSACDATDDRECLETVARWESVLNCVSASDDKSNNTGPPMT